MTDGRGDLHMDSEGWFAMPQLAVTGSPAGSAMGRPTKGRAKITVADRARR
jgi:hypothetical protein